MRLIKFLFCLCQGMIQDFPEFYPVQTSQIAWRRSGNQGMTL